MALTSVPPAGSKLRGSVLAALFAERTPLSGLKTSDQNVGPSNTVLTDVTEVSIVVAASATYEFRLYFQYATNTTADVKIGWTGPAGFAMDYGFMLLQASETWLTGRTTHAVSLPAGGGFNYFHLGGSITTGANAGTVQLQAAQQVSTAVTTNVEAGTLLIAHRIS